MEINNEFHDMKKIRVEYIDDGMISEFTFSIDESSSVEIIKNESLELASLIGDEVQVINIGFSD